MIVISSTYKGGSAMRGIYLSGLLKKSELIEIRGDILRIGKPEIWTAFVDRINGLSTEGSMDFIYRKDLERAKAWKWIPGVTNILVNIWGFWPLNLRLFEEKGSGILLQPSTLLSMIIGSGPSKAAEDIAAFYGVYTAKVSLGSFPKEAISSLKMEMRGEMLWVDPVALRENIEESRGHLREVMILTPRGGMLLPDFMESYGLIMNPESREMLKKALAQESPE